MLLLLLLLLLVVLLLVKLWRRKKTRVQRRRRRPGRGVAPASETPVEGIVGGGRRGGRGSPDTSAHGEALDVPVELSEGDGRREREGEGRREREGD